MEHKPHFSTESSCPKMGAENAAGTLNPLCFGTKMQCGFRDWDVPPRFPQQEQALEATVRMIFLLNSILFGCILHADPVFEQQWLCHLEKLQKIPNYLPVILIPVLICWGFFSLSHIDPMINLLSFLSHWHPQSC